MGRIQSQLNMNTLAWPSANLQKQIHLDLSPKENLECYTKKKRIKTF